MTCRVLQRRLRAPIDPLALYAALTNGGARRDTALFEGADGITLVMSKAAVRAEWELPVIEVRRFIRAPWEKIIDN